MLGEKMENHGTSLPVEKLFTMPAGSGAGLYSAFSLSSLSLVKYSFVMVYCCTPFFIVSLCVCK